MFVFHFIMGKKRKGQETVKSAKKLTNFNCPSCKRPGCVKVHISKIKEIN